MSGKYSGQRQRNLVTPGILQGFSDAYVPYPYITNYGITVDYVISPTTFIEGTYGQNPERIGGRQRKRHSRQRGIQPPEESEGLPDAVSGCGRNGSERYYGYKVMEEEKPPFWDGKSLNLPPIFGWGSRIGAAPPQQRYPGWLNINRTPRPGHQPDAHHRAAHDQGRVLPQPQLQGAERGRRRHREPELPGLRELR